MLWIELSLQISYVGALIPNVTVSRDGHFKEVINALMKSLRQQEEAETPGGHREKLCEDIARRQPPVSPGERLHQKLTLAAP